MTYSRPFVLIYLASVFVPALNAWAGGSATTVNSLQMQLLQIQAGNFEMGSATGDFDEKPVHTAVITKPFWMSRTDVTNTQYEQFDPAHQKLRGKHGGSKEDDEAVVFVSYEDATKFCNWLSVKEGKPYRLPTEAEWEFACRAGTTTAFNTGDKLPAEYQKHQKDDWYPAPALQAVRVGQTPPNAFGLCDMHGLVEQWCYDWYGPYEGAEANDPVGRAEGDFRVTRGGSFNTDVRYLRSANRLGTVPGDRNWLIGFRVVQAELPATKPLPPMQSAHWAQDVSQANYDWKPAPEMSRPYFAEPISYLNIPPGSNGPLFSKHNHCPSICACPNGDLLVTFYTCDEESGREMSAAITRYIRGSDHWDADEIFYKAPDRNMHATAVWWDGKQTLYHFQGVGVSTGWRDQALLFRTSIDNGVNWSQPRWIEPEHQLRNVPTAGVIQSRDGTIICPCDAVTEGDGGSALHISTDFGQTWTDPGLTTTPLRPDYSSPGTIGGSIAGIHTKLVELNDGRWLAFGRGNSINGRMPQSLSSDHGKTWSYSATQFPPIGSGQRLVLMRLQEGPLLLISFANDPGLELPSHQTVHGMYAALSYDEGKTWPDRKLLTPGSRQLNGGGWTGPFKTDLTHAEPKGYLAATQSPDGMVQLVSSALHYRFNLAWLKKP